MAEIFCKYCQHNWKYKKDYEKHLACCEYFYQLRRNPKNEMDDFGNKLPSHKELFRFVQELSLKCERLEREVARLKNSTSIRQKKVIVDCLNHSITIPKNTFCEWWKQLTLQLSIQISNKEEIAMNEHWSNITNPFLFRVFQQGLLDGIKYVLESYIGEYKKKHSLPIRCFIQKPNMFYIYSGDNDICESAVLSASYRKSLKPQFMWKTMTNTDLETMMDYISQLFVREFLNWQRINSDMIDNNEKRGEEQITYMMRVNSIRPSKEKGIAEIRKWLFSMLEENAQTMAECEYV